MISSAVKTTAFPFLIFSFISSMVLAMLSLPHDNFRFQILDCRLKIEDILLNPKSHISNFKYCFALLGLPMIHNIRSPPASIVECRLRSAECKRQKTKHKFFPVFHYSRIFYFNPLNSQVLIYRSPVSGRMTTIIFPLLPCLFATSMAAQTAAPEEIPANTPSSLASLLVNNPASSFDTLITSSTKPI